MTSPTHISQQPMTICLVFTHGISLKTWAQNGTLKREIVPYIQLAQTGRVRIIFLTYGGTDDLAFQDDLTDIEILPLFQSKEPPSSAVGLFFSAILALWVHRDRLCQVDIFKSNQMLGSHLAWLAAKLFSARFILRSGYEFYSFIKQRQAGSVKRMIAWMVSWIGYKTADHIVVATRDDANFAASHFGASTDTIDIQPNWIDTDLFAPMPDLPTIQRDFVTVCRLDQQKNLEAVITAAQQADISLDIIGDGPLRSELTALATRVGADIRFLGMVPNIDLPRHFAAYRGFLLCSHFEGNPKALLEAMACGMPVIGTRAPGIEPIITHNVDGLLCDTDTASIATAMTALKTDEISAAHHGQSARATVLATNSLAQFVKAEIARYSSLIARN